MIEYQPHYWRGFGRLWLVAAISLVAMPVYAEGAGDSVDQALADASEAYTQGDYRIATAHLDDVSGSLERLVPAQRLQYWDLRTSVDLVSGLLEEAERAAQVHLDLLRQMLPANATDRANAEPNAMVRLASIERALVSKSDDAAAKNGEGPGRLARARELLTGALAKCQGLTRRDQLREAEIHLELARTYESLRTKHDAQAEFKLAAAGAMAAIEQLRGTKESTDDFLRGLAVLEHSVGGKDQESAAGQTRQALLLINDRLGVEGLSLPHRVKLLAGGAACYRRLNDPERESQMLTSGVNAGLRNRAVDQLLCGGMLVRLTELAEADPKPRDNARTDRIEKLYAEAAGVYQRLLDAAKANRSAQSEERARLSRGQVCECWLQLQLIYTRTEKWDRAIDAASELLKLRQQSLLADKDPNVYRAKESIGALHAKAARSARERSVEGAGNGGDMRAHVVAARRFLGEALAFWQYYRPLQHGDLATTLNYYAEMLRYDGDFRRANQLLDEALPHFNLAYDPTDLRVGEFYSNRAAVLAALGQFVTAQTYYEQAVAVCEVQGTADVRARQGLLAIVRLNEAQLFKSQRQFAEAQQMCSKAMEAADQAGLKPEDRIPFLLTQSSLLVAAAELTSAKNRRTLQRQSADQHDDDVAERLKSAIATAQEAEAIAGRGTMTLNLATAYHLQALAWYRLGVLCGGGDAALTKANELWTKLSEQSDDRTPGIDVLRVRALNNLAAIQLREAGASRAAQRQARDADEAASRKQQLEQQIQSADQLSEEAERLSSAVDAYPAVRLQVLFTRAQVLDTTAQLRRAEAKAAQQAGEEQAAAKSADEAHANSNKAIEKLFSALEILEMPRAMIVGAEDERAEYLSQFSPVFDLLVDLLVGQNRLQEAIGASEQRRSRTFLDQLRTAGVNMYDGLPESERPLVAEEQEIRGAICTVLTRIRETSDSKAIKNEDDKLQVLEARYDQVHRKLVSASPALRQSLVEPLKKQRASAAAAISDSQWLAEHIGSGNLALIYYLGNSKSYVFVCSAKSGIHCFPLEVSEEQAYQLRLAPVAARDAARATRPLRADDAVALVNPVIFVVNPDAVRSSRGSNYRLVSSEEYQQAQIPLVTEILVPQRLREEIESEHPSHVLIIPDGPLHELPFEALSLDSKGQSYLLDVMPPIAYLPSLEIYRHLMDEPRARDVVPSLLSVANPNYTTRGRVDRSSTIGEHATSAAEYLALGGSLEGLPQTAVESRLIGNTFQTAFPASKVVRLLEQDATEANVREQLKNGQFSYVHFAVHGFEDLSYRALALSTPELPTANDDGFLSLPEILALPRLSGCELVVLSACETNYGPQRPLEAGSTLSRAFICAGARRVVSSDWSVGDRATSQLIGELMRTVTEALSRGQEVDYAQALLAAKTMLRHNQATSAPRDWAAFVLIGPPVSGDVGRAPAPLATTHE